MVAADRY